MARSTCQGRRQEPRQSDLKRPVSTAYYALFHTLARECADLLLGTGPNVDGVAWTHIYRHLQHGTAKTFCLQAANQGFPQGVITFADTFVQMQGERERADYNPNSRFSRPVVLDLINTCEKATLALKAESRPGCVRQVL